MKILRDPDHRLYRSPEGRTVAGDIRLYAVLIARKKNGRAVTAYITGDDDLITRSGKCTRGLNSFHDLTHTGRRNEEAVDLPFARHLGVACDDSDTRFPGSLRHSRDDFLELIYRKTFLDDKCTRKIERLSAHTCQIVDGSADTELTYISAREFIR